MHYRKWMHRKIYDDIYDILRKKVVFYAHTGLLCLQMTGGLSAACCNVHYFLNNLG